jgi:general secretion pathway protein H
MKSVQGFSLLEILVVLLIVGLFSAMSVAWLDSGPAPMNRALEQLAAEAQAQAARARHSGQVLGLRWNGREPEFVRLQSDKTATRWVRESSRSRVWPDELRADLPTSSEPVVVFTPAGVAQAAVMNWRWPTGLQRWQWRTDNSLSRVDVR